MTQRSLAIALLIGLAGSVASPTAGWGRPAVAHVLLICIDGLRPDAITDADTPHLARLRQRGLTVRGARCMRPALTVPNVVSLLTGLAPSTHGFLRNDGSDTRAVPGTLLQLVRDAGGTAALYAAKRKLSILAPPGSTDRTVVMDAPVSGSLIDAVLADLRRPSGWWTLSVLHMQEPDFIGHQQGWMSEPYRQAAAAADWQIGRLVAALDEQGLLESTLLIVTADHGGEGMSHVGDAAAVVAVPWIAAGAGVPRGVVVEQPIQTIDTAPTILRALGVPVPRSMEGVVIEEVVGAEAADAATPRR